MQYCKSQVTGSFISRNIYTDIFKHLDYIQIFKHSNFLTNFWNVYHKMQFYQFHIVAPTIIIRIIIIVFNTLPTS